MNEGFARDAKRESRGGGRFQDGGSLSPAAAVVLGGVAGAQLSPTRATCALSLA